MIIFVINLYFYIPEIFRTMPEASSTLPAGKNNSYGVENLVDGNPATAWVEGVDGYGEGETLDFCMACNFDYDCGSEKIYKINIVNGYAKNETTYKRKFNEILKALNFEKNYSKKDIIEAYLNTVSLGAGCYGVKTAAETYFGKEVSELNLLECCALAGITKAPYTNNPYVNKDGNFQKRIDRCLYAMWEEGKISEKTYNKYLGKSPKVKPKGSVSTDSEEKTDILSWYEEYVIDQVIADLQKEYEYDYQEASRMIYYGGLRIYAAVDIDMQKTLEDMYRNRTGFPSS